MINQAGPFLTSACAGDSDLQQEIESVLVNRQEAERLFTRPALERWARAVVPSSSISYVGQAFGRYEIRALIGSGSLGEVYRARDRRLHRDVAIKVLPEAFGGDPDRPRRFDYEARAITGLHHPNILVLYDIGSHDHQPFMVMELLTGETLARRLIQGPLSPIDAVDLATQVGQALGVAHKIGIVHHDLRPANIFITHRLHAKVLDFGLSNIRTCSVATTSQRHVPIDASWTTPAIGTLQYMSPQQVTGARADPRLDVSSLRVVLYEMVTGHLPFRGAERAALAKEICSATPAPPSQLCSDIPFELDRVVSRALAKNPEDRYQAEELVSDLQRVRVVCSQRWQRPAGRYRRWALKLPRALRGRVSR